MAVLHARPSRALSGDLTVPGDKSISHRALILGALALGRTSVTGLLEGEDVMATAEALRRLGAEIRRLEDGSWEIHGCGVGGLCEPDQVLDLGNSGTGARLLIGVAASHPFSSFFTGDASLRTRPMARVTDPLTVTGARFVTRTGGRLPLCVIGTDRGIPARHAPPVASAQVKSAILLAGLNIAGATSLVESRPTRDHTETLFRHFGVDVRVEETEAGGRAVTVTGQAEITGRPVAVPADPSSAAFPLVAALVTQDSDITLKRVGINPLRAGLFRTLEEMGAEIAFAYRQMMGGEPVADLRARSSRLTGVEVPAARAAQMIDEYPILAVAAACAHGTTIMHGLGELRVKESDRLAATAGGLAAAGVAVEQEGDRLVVHGTGAPPAGGVSLSADLDHRMAMAFLVLGLASRDPIRVTGTDTIATSFPGFTAAMTGLGARIGTGPEDAGTGGPAP